MYDTHFSFWLTSLWMTVSKSIHIASNDPVLFLFMHEQHSILCMAHTFYIHSSVDGHSDCFHVLATANSALMPIFLKSQLQSLTVSVFSPSPIPPPYTSPCYDGSWPMDQGPTPREGDKPCPPLLLYNVPLSLWLPCFTSFIWGKHFQVTGWLWAISNHHRVSLSSPKWESCRKWPLGPLPKLILADSLLLWHQYQLICPHCLDNFWTPNCPVHLQAHKNHGPIRHVISKSRTWRGWVTSPGSSKQSHRWPGLLTFSSLTPLPRLVYHSVSHITSRSHIFSEIMITFQEGKFTFLQCPWQ